MSTYVCVFIKDLKALADNFEVSTAVEIKTITNNWTHHDKLNMKCWTKICRIVEEAFISHEPVDIFNAT